MKRQYMMNLLIFITLIFSSSFEAQSGTLAYSKAGVLTTIEGCEMTYMSISDTTVYAIDYYLFECDDTLPERVFGAGHKSAVFINKVGIYCNVDLFQYHSNTDFNMVLVCD